MNFVNKFSNQPGNEMFTRLAIFCTLALIATLGFGADLAQARQPLPNLQVGMGYNQVAALLGAAEEKIERETKREELWHYSHTDALFRDGKVVSWHRVGQADSATYALNQLPSANKVSQRTKPQKRIPLTDILTEIEQSNPQEGAGGPGGPGGPGNIRGLPPPTDFANQVQRLAERGDGE